MILCWFSYFVLISKPNFILFEILRGTLLSQLELGCIYYNPDLPGNAVWHDLPLNIVSYSIERSRQKKMEMEMLSTVSLILRSCLDLYKNDKVLQCTLLYCTHTPQLSCCTRMSNYCTYCIVLISNLNFPRKLHFHSLCN